MTGGVISFRAKRTRTRPRSAARPASAGSWRSLIPSDGTSVTGMPPADDFQSSFTTTSLATPQPQQRRGGSAVAEQRSASDVARWLAVAQMGSEVDQSEADEMVGAEWRNRQAEQAAARPNSACGVRDETKSQSKLTAAGRTGSPWVGSRKLAFVDPSGTSLPTRRPQSANEVSRDLSVGQWLDRRQRHIDAQRPPDRWPQQVAEAAATAAGGRSGKGSSHRWSQCPLQQEEQQQEREQQRQQAAARSSRPPRTVGSSSLTTHIAVESAQSLSPTRYYPPASPAAEGYYLGYNAQDGGGGSGGGDGGSGGGGESISRNAATINTRLWQRVLGAGAAVRPPATLIDRSILV